jgi:hypothetical protein
VVGIFSIQLKRMSGRRHMVARHLALLCLLLPTSASRADYVPQRGADSIFLFSTDLSPVTVRLFHEKVGKADFPDAVIPRAYIVAVGDRDGSQSPLPDEFEAQHFEIMFMDGSGEAWNVAVSDASKAEGISLKAAGERLRPKPLLADIRTTTIPDGRPKGEIRDKAKYKPQPSSADGLTMYRDGASRFEYYFGEPIDSFVVTRCAGPATQSARGQFCEFTVSISSLIVADISFVDFRTNGGRSWANQKLRSARQQICKFLTRC